jgi:hypothetical protein
MGSVFKASFHLVDGAHHSAVWIASFTSESGVVIEGSGSRRSHTWQVQTPSPTGVYLGPTICIPRLDDRPYDLPPTGRDVEDLSGMQWVEPPGAGRARFLRVLLSDDRTGIEYQLAQGESVVGTLPMSTGWDVSVLTAERSLKDDERTIIGRTHDEADIAISPRLPEGGTDFAAMIWVTTSPTDGSPMFVQIVLGSDNCHLASTC